MSDTSTLQLARMAQLEDLPVSARIRLAFVDHLLTVQGRINRSDLMCAFGISQVQASKDLQSFRDIFSSRIEYDANDKTYRPRRQSAPVFPALHRNVACGVVVNFVQGFGNA